MKKVNLNENGIILLGKSLVTDINSNYEKNLILSKKTIQERKPKRYDVFQLTFFSKYFEVEHESK